MRPNNNNNQNKRSRGRNNGRGKQTNPLSRNFESNGPDVKVRGNASHIAEKYMQLARDAQTSGDSVMAENYFQHAEHYFRIVSAAQALNPPREQTQQNEQPQPQQQPAQADESSSNEAPAAVETPVVVSEAAASGEAATSEAACETAPTEETSEAAPVRKPRERRPRRKPRVKEETVVAADPSAAPQPDVGDLPAFLTGGVQTDAAE